MGKAGWPNSHLSTEIALTERNLYRKWDRCTSIQRQGFGSKEGEGKGRGRRGEEKKKMHLTATIIERDLLILHPLSAAFRFSILCDEVLNELPGTSPYNYLFLVFRITRILTEMSMEERKNGEKNSRGTPYRRNSVDTIVPGKVRHGKPLTCPWFGDKTFSK